MKIDLRQVIKDMFDEPVNLGASIDNTPFRVINEVLKDRTSQEAKDIVKAINDTFGRPLNLLEVVLQALCTGYEDDKSLSMSDRMKRNQLARKLNRLGKVNVSEDERKIIEPLLYKRFPGAIVAPQADLLLQGKEYKLSEPEPEPEPELVGPDKAPSQSKPGAVEGAPIAKEMARQALEEDTILK